MADLKTALQQVLAQTPLQPKPLKERVWLWIKDHPGRTRPRIQADLKLTDNEVKNALHELRIKGLIEGVAGTGANRGNGGKPLSVYKVTTDQWEDLPWPKQAKKQAPAPRWSPSLQTPVVTPKPQGPQNTVFGVRVAPEPVAPQQQPTQAPKPESRNLVSEVENLTIAQGRELYKLLHKIYGGGA